MRQVITSSLPLEVELSCGKYIDAHNVKEMVVGLN